MTYNGQDAPEPPIVPYYDDDGEGSGALDLDSGRTNWAAIEFDNLTVITTALLLVGAGVLVFIASRSNAIENPLIHYSNLLWWLVLGAGVVILFMEIVVRALIPRFRTQIGQRLVVVTILLTVGVGGRFDWGSAIAVLLVGLGLALPVIVFGARQS